MERSYEVGPTEWPRFLGSLVRERLTGFAVAAAEQGSLTLGDGEREELLEQHRSAMLWAVRVEQTLLDVYHELGDRGVTPIVLKGPALAHTVYPDPSLRAFRDVDLLVFTRDWRAACTVLETMGMRRRLPEPRPGFDERFGKAAVYTSDGAVQIDLHRSLTHGPFGLWMRTDELFARTALFELAGTNLRRLDDTGLFLHACIHATLGWTPPEILALRDVAQVAIAADVDWEALERLASRWRLSAVLAHAVQSTIEAFGAVVPPQARRLLQLQIGPRESQVLRAYTTGRRWRGATVLSTVRAIPGLRAKSAYIRAMVFPAREFMTKRAGGIERALYVRRLAVPLRWILRSRFRD